MDKKLPDHHFLDLFSSMPEALIFADAAGMIRTWNHGATTLFGFTETEAVGQCLDIIIPEMLREAHWKGYHQALARGATAHSGRSRITKALHKEGQALYVDMSFAVVKDAQGETTGAMAVARDATQRYLEEKEMRRLLAAMPQKTPEK